MDEKIKIQTEQVYRIKFSYYSEEKVNGYNYNDAHLYFSSQDDALDALLDLRTARVWEGYPLDGAVGLYRTRGWERIL